MDPDWIEQPRGSRRPGPAGRRAAAGTDPTGEPLLPIRVKALWLLGDRLGLDVGATGPARYGCDVGRLDRRTAAASIAELTHLVLVSPTETARR